jgi:hypothetical protein
MRALLQATTCTTRVKTQDDALNVYGVAASCGDRVELSLSRQDVGTGPTGPALGAVMQEDDWRDVFIAWAANKSISLMLAYVELGRIVPAVVTRCQHGADLSAQLAF